MHLLVTRPEPAATELEERLVALGHRVSLAPLLKIVFEPADPIELEGVQALIATSANGLAALRAGAPLAPALRLPIFVVGPATAQRARSMGFARVIEAQGTARDLVPPIAATSKPRDGALLHLAGGSLAFDLKGALERRGFSVRQPVVYRAQAAERFPAEVADAIRSGALDGVILMSPRTAETFTALAAVAGLVEAARRLIYLCLSPSVAARLAPLAPREVRVAAAPNLEEMLALIARMAPESI